MSLINNPNKKDPLDRGHEITPEKEFTLDDLTETKKKETQEKTLSSKDNVSSVTFYANIRINNHIKNIAEAIAINGYSKSQKDSIEKALNYFLDSFSKDERRGIETSIETLEQRDVFQKHKKLSN
ncbi:DUF5388 domain-containing protein [Lentilactobacillus parafarraginis]|uniref:Uncharacterized protein n=1 Tax=Lentilactobacillus parafarraginis DSM 18390 = JCM 14109 TaxID=1423786 RepID=A0A0R1YI11_9LACO|nr:DUF5388 domain-containing protein [Lentilactobacillus parafarraginis]KRM38819.1 hypothetical protein FD47_GL000228 [Lentilactobacillus parafarraginis DSM 18390 = JCM 14109]